MPSKLTSWRTTVYGAMLSGLAYWEGIGFKIPETRQEVVTLLGSLLVLLFGLAARDAKVSQQAHQEEKIEQLTQDASKIVKP